MSPTRTTSEKGSPASFVPRDWINLVMSFETLLVASDFFQPRWRQARCGATKGEIEIKKIEEAGRGKRGYTKRTNKDHDIAVRTRAVSYTHLRAHETGRNLV